MQKLYLKQLFVAVLALLCSVMVNAHDFEVDGIFYNINGSEVTVTYKGDTYSDYSNEYSGNVLIPNSVTYNGNTYSVTRIGERAFCNCSVLTSVTIPNIVSSIGFAAFERCSGLTSVIIGNSVTSIANYAFYDCVRLARVEIPNSVTSIGYNAYYGCGNLKTVINFSNLQLSKGSIYGGYIAYYADKLVNVPNGFIKDGFAWCKIDGENILCGYVGNNIQFTLPDNCDGEDYAIGKSTFEGCCGLMSIEIPNSVTSIGDSAFYGCSGLTSVKIGNSVTSINDDAFGGCTNLNNIFYTSAIPPTSLWLAVNTYVPNTEDYAKSTISGGNGNFIEYVTYKNTNFTYGEIPQTVFVNNLESFGYTTNVIFPKLSTNAGTYTINIPFTFTKGNNHFDVNIPYKYIINKAPLVVKTDSFSRLYGEENPSFTITYSGFVNGENESVLTNKGTATTSATAKSDVGDYYIVVSGAAAENYEMQYEKGSLTINKAPLTIAVNNASKVYGDGNPKFTLEYSGLKNNETSPKMVSAIDITTDATKLSNVGEYDITISGGEAKNYEITNYINGKLAVTKAPLTITAKNFTKIYGSINPEFKYSYNGAKNNDNESRIFETLPTISCVANETSNVGEYEIEIGNASSNNYEILYKSGILSVVKREIIVSTKNYTRIYGEENPNFEISYNGFVNNEDESVLLIQPKAKTNADKDSDVGVYDISIEGGDDDNYSFAYNNGILTIEKANQIITWEQEFDDLVVGSQIELTAKASSGLDIEYIIPDNNFLSVYTVGRSTYLDCYDAGEIVVRAIQNGNKNYNAAVRVSKVIKIVPTSINSVSVDTAVNVNGNSITLSGANNSTIAIYTANGALVEKIDSYAGEEITLDKGLYIVRVGNKTMKVRL